MNSQSEVDGAVYMHHWEFSIKEKIVRVYACNDGDQNLLYALVYLESLTVRATA